MPHYLSPQQMDSLARPGSHVEQVPSFRVLAAQRALFLRLYYQRYFGLDAERLTSSVITVVEERDVPIWFQSTKEVGQSTESFGEFCIVSVALQRGREARHTKSKQTLIID